VSNFTEETSNFSFTGFGSPGYTTRAFPVPASPSPSPTEYGEVKPGRTNVGFSLSPDAKTRLEEILVDTAQRTSNAYGNVLAAGAQRTTKKLTRGAPLDRTLASANSPNTASDIINQLGQNRQTVIIVVAAIIFVVVMMVARKGA
jgi:hypothetical protein